ncbi:MAG TPA: glycosyltransferase [Planctomycetota bacterium]|nr:glycosyltransferase [Planctomycetota bacterium]
MARRVLIVSVSAGAGHVRAAQAVTEALSAAHADAVTVKNVDCMDYSFWPFRHMYAGSYLTMVNRLPGLWGRIYRGTARQGPRELAPRLCRQVERFFCWKLGRLIRSFSPDEIMANHPLPAHYACGLKRRGLTRARISVGITDYCLHPLWTHPDVDQYFASCPEVAYLVERLGAAPGRIRTTGIPLVPAFARPVPADERVRLRREMMLADGRPTVLCSAGGFGVGHIRQTIRAAVAAAARAGGADILVVAGRNQKLRAELQAMSAPEGVKLTVFGFVTNMHELMAAADVMITKPGGLTVSEGLARSLPMIVLDPIPGQEEANAAYLQENGAAWLALDNGSLEYKLCRLLASADDRAAMRRACERIARPKAAFEVARVLAEGC